MNTLRPGHKLLTLGGIRSGKSRFAENMAIASAQAHNQALTYIATAQAFDDEMLARIEAHKDRRDAIWQSIEAPIALPEAVDACSNDTVILVDCLSLWVSNLMLENGNLDVAKDALIEAASGKTIIFVSNEVGLGGISANAMQRRFADHCGLLHQQLADNADAVTLIVAGLPLWLKQPTPSEEVR